MNKKTADGVDNAPDAPAYRIEFQSDRLYQQDKVTPINAAEDEDELVNSKKLIDIGESSCTLNNYSVNNANCLLQRVLEVKKLFDLSVVSVACCFNSPFSNCLLRWFKLRS